MRDTTGLAAPGSKDPQGTRKEVLEEWLGFETGVRSQQGSGSSLGWRGVMQNGTEMSGGGEESLQEGVVDKVEKVSCPRREQWFRGTG